MDYLVQQDIALFKYLNGLHTPFWDPIMIWITDQVSWIWMFVIIVLAIIYFMKKDAILTLVVLIASVVAADHFASSLFKPLVKRLRPCKEAFLASDIHNPIGCGGQFGFFSSHACNSFVLAFFIWFLLPKGKKTWSAPLFVWACLFSYSRIYLGKHYPLDIVCGAISGFLLALLFYKVGMLIDQKIKDKKRVTA